MKIILDLYYTCMKRSRVWYYLNLFYSCYIYFIVQFIIFEMILKMLKFILTEDYIILWKAKIDSIIKKVMGCLFIIYYYL